MVKVTAPGLWKGRPVDALTESKKRGSGRNNLGHITTRHRGGGHKAQYRIVDFRRNKDGIPAKVERLEYDPNRTAHIALLCYADGERRYIIAPRGLEVGASLLSGSEAPAERAICAPLPGSISMQWIVEPTGMLRIGSVLPGRIGASAPFISTTPGCTPRGARM